VGEASANVFPCVGRRLVRPRLHRADDAGLVLGRRQQS